MIESKSPSENLSSIVVDRLIASGLVRLEKRDALVASIANGAMTGEDWRLEIELAAVKGNEA